MTSRSGLAGFQEYCLSHGLPFVSYRLPNEKIPVTLISNSGIRQLVEVESSSSGFLMTPFKKDKPKLWLNADQVFYGDEVSSFDIKSLHPEAYKQFNTSTDDFLPKPVTKNEYLEKISFLLNSIHSGIADKVVLSRPMLVEFNRSEESVLLFKKLTNSLQAAFVYLLSFPGAGTWLGASPELLLRVSHQEEEPIDRIETMALAGTRKTGSIEGWGIKEIDEQTWVSNFILQKLQQAGVRGIEQSNCYSAVAGNVEHLRSDFKASVTDGQSLRIADILHPTPAICGWPAETALELITKIEKYDRSFYSGYLGPVNLNNHSDLFVNLRCMKIAENEASLFVGGGITAGSDPLKEWAETLIKSRTLLAEIEKIRNLAS